MNTKTTEELRELTNDELIAYIEDFVARVEQEEPALLSAVETHQLSLLNQILKMYQSRATIAAILDRRVTDNRRKREVLGWTLLTAVGVVVIFTVSLARKLGYI